MAILSVNNVSKKFGDVNALDNVSFSIHREEFLSLLGPSGCGKTTALRIIAGLEEPTSGRVDIEGKDVTSVPPFRRNTGMVFQSYALFPHMSIYENIAFGLRMRKMDQNTIKTKVEDALELFHLSGYNNRYPHQLSGGEQQRVALARALAIEPILLLLDEPLSNLDAKLREEMRTEVKLIHKKVGISTLFVTHDQEEALTLSDRVLVMDRGTIVESGTPAQIYQNPSSAFTADFIGHSNLLNAKIVNVGKENMIVETVSGWQISASIRQDLSIGEKVLVVVKQESIKLEIPEEQKIDYPTSDNLFNARIGLVNFLGPTIHFICELEGGTIQVRCANSPQLRALHPGQDVRLRWEPEDNTIIKN